MLITALVAATLAVSAPPPQSQITYITREYYAPQQEIHNLELSPVAQPQVVGTIPETESANDQWSQREELGGQDAPDWIVIRHRDGLFAIDPFIKLPKATPEAARQLFKAMEYGTSGPVVNLDTDMSFYGRDRINRTEELFQVLETQRILWLKAKGYLGGVRTVNGSQHATNDQTRNRRIHTPEDRPRTRPVESVRAMPSRATILAGDQTVRISMPDLGTSRAVRDRVAARGGVIVVKPARAELAEKPAPESEESQVEQ
jgi:hypothetical protein